MIIKELSKRQKLKIGEEKNIRNEALVPPTKEKGSALEILILFVLTSHENYSRCNFLCNKFHFCFKRGKISREKILERENLKEFEGKHLTYGVFLSHHHFAIKRIGFRISR